MVPCVEAPTAQALEADVAATAASWLPPLNPAGSGLACCCQAVPFQCSIRVLVAGFPPTNPAVQALAWEIAATDSRSAWFTTGCCCFQAVPFQCSRSVPSLPPFVLKEPLAQALEEEVAVTERRTFLLLEPVPPGLGLGT